MNIETTVKYKAVIFDLDGTLLDTIDDLANSMNSVLQRCGCPTHDVEKYKYFVGDGMMNLVKRALPAEMCNEVTVNRCLDDMRREYSLRWAEKSCTYKGIPELLDLLQEKGIKMSILSNKPDDFTKKVVEKILPNWKFEVVYGERPGVPKKPAPDGALEIARLINVEPADILYLGDTDTDMQTANAAGLYAVGVLWGFRKADELLQHGARILISKPEELLRVL